MTDTYTDLATLADGQPPDPRYGRMLVKSGSVWSYPGCPTNDPRASNLVLPVFNVPDYRVQAALADGLWIPFELSPSTPAAPGKPVKVVEATSAWALRLPIHHHEVGTVRTLPPVQALQVQILRGSPLAPVNGFYSYVTATWLAAWQAGAVTNADGGNLGDRHLTLRVTLPVVTPAFPAPLAGDRLAIGGSYYMVNGVSSVGGQVYDIALSRYVVQPGTLAA